jgi:hypothetical protein
LPPQSISLELWREIGGRSSTRLECYFHSSLVQRQKYSVRPWLYLAPALSFGGRPVHALYS